MIEGVTEGVASGGVLAALELVASEVTCRSRNPVSVVGAENPIHGL
jgi:hypothetical protein